MITAGREDKDGPDQAVSSVLSSFIQTAGKRAPGSLCALLAGISLLQWLSSVLVLPADLGKNWNPLSTGHKAVTEIRRQLPLVVYYCILYTYRCPFFASLREGKAH